MNTTVTDSASNTASTSHTVYVSDYPVITSYSLTGSRTAFTVGESISVTWNSANTSIVRIIETVPGYLGYDRGSSGSFALNNYSTGSITFYIYPLFFNGSYYYTNSFGISYTVYAAPTVTFGSTTTAPPYNSSTSSSTTVKSGDAAYFNWTTTGAVSLVYYQSINGGGYTGPGDITANIQGPSGPQNIPGLSVVTATASATLTIYIVATNAAGRTATSSTASITWTPYNEVLTCAPQTFSSSVGCQLTVTGCYPNESISYSINNTSYADGTQTASASGIYLNTCLLYTSPSPRDRQKSRMPSSA